MAFISDRGGQPEVWVQDLPTAPGADGVGVEPPVPQRVRVDSADPVVSVSWSADSRWLACCVATDGGVRTQVWVVRPDGTGARRIAGSETVHAELGPWTRSGHRVVVTLPGEKPGEPDPVPPGRPDRRAPYAAGHRGPDQRPRPVGGRRVHDRQGRPAGQAVLRPGRPGGRRRPSAAALPGHRVDRPGHHPAGAPGRPRAAGGVRRHRRRAAAPPARRRSRRPGRLGGQVGSAGGPGRRRARGPGRRRCRHHAAPRLERGRRRQRAGAVRHPRGPGPGGARARRPGGLRCPAQPRRLDRGDDHRGGQAAARALGAGHRRRWPGTAAPACRRCRIAAWSSPRCSSSSAPTACR